MNIIKYAAIALAICGNLECINAMWGLQQRTMDYFSHQAPLSDYSPVKEKNFYRNQTKRKNQHYWNTYKENMTEYELNVIEGNPQPTSPGHRHGSIMLARQYANDDNVEEVHLNQELNTITGGLVNSHWRPDVAVKKKDGSFFFTEIRSRTEKEEDQIKKLDQICDMSQYFNRNESKVYNHSDFPPTPDIKLIKKAQYSKELSLQY
ncbi:MAG: hypothetical protein IJA14_02630 [Alphaproteobacteria bacterium]|nr:hypothetical protein [Alphaproteobacteria bacterium]